MISCKLAKQDYKIFSWFLLVIGLISTLGGIFGIWIQGLFYENGFPTPATFEEVQLAFIGPVIASIFGTMLVSLVLFYGYISSSWSTKKRISAFLFYCLAQIFACIVFGNMAARRVEGLLN